MKKKFIVPIVLSSIGLLIGGLIYLGISSFPELLESEKAVKPVNNVVPFVDDTIVVEGDKLFQEEPNVVFGAEISDSVIDYFPSSLSSADVQYIDAPTTFQEAKTPSTLIEINHVEFTFVDENETVAIEEHCETPVDSFVVETIETPHEHFGYSSKENSVETNPVKVKKAKSAKANKNQKIRSNEALVETSLLVIGAVDVFSMILIHRRKHLFR